VANNFDIGDIAIDVLDTDDAEGSASTVSGGVADFDVTVDAIEAGGESASAEAVEYEIGNLDFLEAGGAEVAEDGTIVADRVSVVTDEKTGVVLIDELVGIISPDGTEIYDETISTIDADGNFAVLGEGLEVVGRA